jgi:hypothetical protein
LRAPASSGHPTSTTPCMAPSLHTCGNWKKRTPSHADSTQRLPSQRRHAANQVRRRPSGFQSCRRTSPVDGILIDDPVSQSEGDPPCTVLVGMPERAWGIAISLSGVASLRTNLIGGFSGLGGVHLANPRTPCRPSYLIIIIIITITIIITFTPLHFTIDPSGRARSLFSAPPPLPPYCVFVQSGLGSDKPRYKCTPSRFPSYRRKIRFLSNHLI